MPQYKGKNPNCKCKTCQTEFYVYPSRIKSGRGRYCSRQCQNIGYEDRVERICTNCETAFTQQRAHANRTKNPFCSKECYENYISIDRVKYCETCGLKIDLPSKILKHRKFCSRKCCSISQVKSKVIVNCKFCGIDVECYPSRIQRFCSNECRIVFHSGETHSQWKDGKRPSARGKNWWTQRRKTNIRDNKTCQICGYNQGMKKKHRYIDVHHIIPFHDFDDYKQANELSNLITLCRSCHSKVEHGKLPCPRRLL